MSDAKGSKAEKPWAADKVERRPVASLINSEYNSRTHSDDQVDQIVASIKEFGFTNPVLVDETGTLIAGHGRVMAAKRLGLEEVPVMVASGWTDVQKRAYIIADNKLALNAGWDEALLASEIEAHNALEPPVTKAGQNFIVAMNGKRNRCFEHFSNSLECVNRCFGKPSLLYRAVM